MFHVPGFIDIYYVVDLSVEIIYGGVYLLWFSFILGAVVIFLCFIIMIIHYHAEKLVKENPKKKKNRPKIKLEPQNKNLSRPNSPGYIPC